MDLREYQQQAHRTEKKVHVAGSDVMVPILGLAGEVGELLNEYKKKLRDGDAHERFPDRVAEELGDILWYVAETATKFALDLNQVAERNLQKTRARWCSSDHDGLLFDRKAHAFDAKFPEHERFPRRFVADFRPWIENGAEKTRVFVDGKQMGDLLTDNAHNGSSLVGDKPIRLAGPQNRVLRGCYKRCGKTVAAECVSSVVQLAASVASTGEQFHKPLMGLAKITGGKLGRLWRMGDANPQPRYPMATRYRGVRES